MKELFLIPFVLILILAIPLEEKKIRRPASIPSYQYVSNQSTCDRDDFEEIEYDIVVVDSFGNYNCSGSDSHGEQVVRSIKAYAPNAKIKRIHTNLSDTSYLAALKRAALYKTKVVNISLVSHKRNDFELKLLKMITRRGVTVVSSSANFGYGHTCVYPACYKIPGLISVGTISDDLHSFKSSQDANIIDYYITMGSIFNDDKGTSFATATLSGIIFKAKKKGIAFQTELNKIKTPITGAKFGAIKREKLYEFAKSL